MPGNHICFVLMIFFGCCEISFKLYVFLFIIHIETRLIKLAATRSKMGHKSTAFGTYPFVLF